MRLAHVALALAAAGCCDPTSIIDSFPVAVELDGGVPILGARAAELMTGALRVVIDTSAPVTVMDEGDGATSRRRLELELLRADVDNRGVARASFQCLPALVSKVGAVGQGVPSEVAGVIGSDVLSRVAVRLDPTRGQIRFFPDIAGSDTLHEDACTAVVDVTLAGGGTYVAGNDAVDFAPTRIVLGACLAPAAERGTAVTGADTLLLVATGVGPTVISRTTARNALGLTEAQIDALPETKIYLPSDTNEFGEVARSAKVPRMALTGRVAGRGPCDELFRSRSLTQCTPQMDATGACTRPTCTSNPDDACAAASVELPGEIDVAIVPDTHPALQALRNELRPEVADISGLLGMQALGGLVVDLDYPSSRVLLRCASAGCTARPRISNSDRETTLRDLGCFP